jgi:hypothetical protein
MNRQLDLTNSRIPLVENAVGSIDFVPSRHFYFCLTQERSPSCSATFSLAFLGRAEQSET